MAQSDALITDLNTLVAWEESVVGWGPTYLSMLGNLRDWALWVPTAFAPAAHSHDGLGGEVMGIGASDARPAVVRGFLHSEIDIPQIAMLDEDGGLLAAAAMQGLPLAFEEQTDDPETVANQIKVYAKAAGLVQRLPSNGPVLPLGGVPKGYISGLVPIYMGGTALGFGGGSLDMAGTEYTLASAFTNLDCSGLGASAWYYVYVGFPASGYALTVSDFSLSTWAPVWADSLGYWERDGKRCVFAFNTDASGNVKGFTVDGATVWINGPSAMLSTSSPASSDTALAVNLPALGALKWFGMMRITMNNAQSYHTYMGPFSTTGAPAMIFDNPPAGGGCTKNFTMMCNDSQQVYYKTAWGGAGTLTIYRRGWVMPAGMAR